MQTARITPIINRNPRSKYINRKTGINEAINARTLRVITENGSLLGVMSKEEALKTAKQNSLDLVLVAANSEPPTARIVDWGKYSYQKKKKQQQIRQANLSKSSNLKQMRFGMKIGDYDLEIKLRKVSKFLEEGCKVRLAIMLRGREMEHKDLAFAMAEKIISKLEGLGVVEQKPQLSGRQISMIIRGGK